MKHILYTLALMFATMQTFAQNYTYNSNNRLTKVEYGNGVTVTYDYDALGNRTSKKVTGATAATFTLTTAVSPSGSGTVRGGGTYSNGACVNLRAISNVGYEFLKWSDGETANPRTVIVTRDMSFTAQFKENSVILDLVGDIVTDGKVNQQDLDALVALYLSDAQANKTTDLDDDGVITIVDIAKIVGVINGSNCPLNNNGHQYVDLGLPSGTLWATCNVGASTPDGLGDCYAWGETETKSNYSWSTYKWCDGDNCNISNPTLTKYCDRGGYGKLDGKLSLELEDDVAHVKWGGDWHIPTQEEFQELLDNCSAKRIVLNEETGQKAYEFTSTNGRSIIMPYTGYWNGETYKSNHFYYWSADLKMVDNPANNSGTHAGALEYDLEYVGLYRYRGYTVRPVLSEYTPVVHKIEAPTSYRNHDLVDLGLPSGTLWATCNLGASSPEGYGCYYAWGETTGSCDGKTSFKDQTYQYYNGSSFFKYNSTDNLINLEKSDDAAYAKWGGEWRMPTWSEMNELKNTKYTTWEWTSVNGINGLRVTSIVKGFEGNSIFLPAGGEHVASKVNQLGEYGYYWSSNLDTDTENSSSACYLYFKSSGWGSGYTSRSAGRSIRPVVSLDAISK